jgi:hypothetical protein
MQVVCVGEATSREGWGRGKPTLQIGPRLANEARIKGFPRACFLGQPKRCRIQEYGSVVEIYLNNPGPDWIFHSEDQKMP